MSLFFKIVEDELLVLKIVTLFTILQLFQLKFELYPMNFEV